MENRQLPRRASGPGCGGGVSRDWLCETVAHPASRVGSRRPEVWPRSSCVQPGPASGMTVPQAGATACPRGGRGVSRRRSSRRERSDRGKRRATRIEGRPAVTGRNTALVRPISPGIGQSARPRRETGPRAAPAPGERRPTMTRGSPAPRQASRHFRRARAGRARKPVLFRRQQLRGDRRAQGHDPCAVGSGRVPSRGVGAR